MTISVRDLEIMLVRLALEAERVGKLFEHHIQFCKHGAQCEIETCDSLTAKSYRDGVEGVDAEQEAILNELRPKLSKKSP